MNAIIDFFKSTGVELVRAISLVILIYLLIQVITGAIRKWIIKKFKERTLPNFVLSVVKILLYVLLIIVVLRLCGITTDNAVTLASVLSLGISLALQDVLSGLVNGVLVIVNKYFVEGEYVQIGGVEGTVVKVTIMATTLKTVDGVMLMVPNTTVASSPVKNFSRLPVRRVTIDVPVSYKSDRELVKKVLIETMKKDSLTLTNPEPTCRLLSYGESDLIFTARCWCKNSNYWDLFFNMNEKIIDCLNANNIQIDYNQIDVNIKNRLMKEESANE